MKALVPLLCFLSFAPQRQDQTNSSPQQLRSPTVPHTRYMTGSTPRTNKEKEQGHRHRLTANTVCS